MDHTNINAPVCQLCSQSPQSNPEISNKQINNYKYNYRLKPMHASLFVYLTPVLLHGILDNWPVGN